MFSILLLGALLYLSLYVALSLPPVQRWIKDVAVSEFNSRSDGSLEIGDVDITPFNEVVLTDVRFVSPEGETVVSASTVGAGINLWRLVFRQKIQITYAELIGLDAHIVQPEPDAPLNIQFIIDGFKSKRKDNKPTRFNLSLENIVIRRGAVTFDRAWLPGKSGKAIDFNHLRLTDIAADLRFPRLRNDNIIVDLRRLAFSEVSGLDVTSLSGKFHVTDKSLTFNDLRLRLPASELHPADMTLRYDGYADIPAALKRSPMHLVMENNMLTPSDFRAFVPALVHYTQTYTLDLDVLKNGDDLKLTEFSLASPFGLDLEARGVVSDALNPRSGNFAAALNKLSLTVSGAEMSRIIADFSPLDQKVNEMLRSLGDVRLEAAVTADRKGVECDGFINTSAGELVLSGSVQGLDGKARTIKGRVSTSGLELVRVLPQSPVENVRMAATVDATLEGKEFNGSLDATVPEITVKGNRYSNLEAHVVKEGKRYHGEASAHDENLSFDIDGHIALDGAASGLNLNADIQHLDFARLNMPGVPPMSVSGFLTADISCISPDRAEGIVEIYDLSYSDPRNGTWTLDHLIAESRREALPYSLTVDCDYLSASLRGDFEISKLPAAFMKLMAIPMPDLIPARFLKDNSLQDCALHLTVYKDTELFRKVKLPVTLLQDLDIDAEMNTADGTATLNIDIPYLQQGKNKLVRDTGIKFTLDNESGLCNLNLSTRLPGAKGPATLMLDANAADNRIDSDLGWIFDRVKNYHGRVSLSTSLSRTGNDLYRVLVDVNPSTFVVNDTTWQIDAGSIEYLPRRLTVNDITVHRPGQYATISGVASDSPEDHLTVSLKNINLDYVFDSLNINYVVFGGDASGDVQVSELFTPHPRLFTDNLDVRNMTYNHSRLGDARIRSWWNNEEKSIRMKALISDMQHQVADVDGSIWLTRDSLSFGFDADRLDVGFLKPFMAAFCDDISGHATGHAHLYGTFKDINLTGKVYADNVKMKIGVTNTEYTASDTVLLTPGKIHLDNITLRDRDGNTGLLNGYVTHEYFHNPTFKFSITNARHLLCYDTNARLNPIWYGTIYASGNGTITGVPGFIDVLVDMTTQKGSTFTFVLDDSEEAIDYQFLTFTDKRKEAEELRLRESMKNEDTEPDFVRAFNRQVAQSATEYPTRYRMDLRISATPDAQAVIVMDPAAGDRIRAYGNGALRFTYNSEGEMGLYGTYAIDRGDYNFTLQELVVRDFKIRQGSRITFSGDPLNASLDITAAYRVNASLTDLDKSFATDNDLNRNNVPVEALLKLSGNMQNPDIDFDIDLPTLNQDVVRKVRSIVSTSDMMNMQMVYLLALNRFYTPDYMNTGGSNNEMASLASATLSTQLTNILGQLSDNWSFAPSFRTGKGDFSDMEVDLALSSTLLNNRLIFNGNLGYRDRATSSTAFVGDFDIEYLLNPQGTLRLKAYNHYNDQNYYLRSALTTQGIGIVYKRDFNRFLPGLFRRRRKPQPALPADSVPSDTILPTDSSNRKK